MGKMRRISRKYFTAAIVVLLGVALTSLGFIFLKQWEREKGTFAEHEFDDSSVEYGGSQYKLKDNVETFLVIGLDKLKEEATYDSYNNDRQADFLMLFIFDNDVGKCSVIHINRDTMAEMNVLGVAGGKIDVVTKQIALSHTYGNGRDVSCRNTADAVSKLLCDIKVDHYISVTMDIVPEINDLLGGVEIEVLDDFSGIDDTLVKGKTITLNGKQAMNYVRSRYGLEDSSNNRRMERQQQYINAAYEQFKQCAANDEEFIVKASLRLSDYMISDRSVTQLQALAEKFNEYEFEGIRALEGEMKKGEEFMEFYPNREALAKLVFEVFYMPEE